MTAGLCICADDYGISPAVSAGIRELAAAGHLSATGVMAGMDAWPDEASALKDLAGRIDVGIHLTLTDQRPLGPMPVFAPSGRFPSVGGLLRLSFQGGLAGREIRDEIARQLDRFEAHFGRPPDFVDGHQHVHLFPGVREEVLALFGGRLDRRRCWLRDCTDAPSRLLGRPLPLKASFIALLGQRLARLAKADAVAMNRGFSGFYDAARMPFGEALPRMLARASDGHLLMVHPGHVDEQLRALDSLTGPREGEWRVLMADDLPVRLAALGFHLAGRAFPG